MTNPVTIVQTGNRYEARFKFDAATKDAVKSAGFRFDWDNKVWWTDNPSIAEKFADPDAARKMHEAKIEAIEASRATNALVDIPAPAGLAYLPFQRAGIAYAMNRPNVMIGDEMGLGKQAPVSEPVLTPDGWKTMGDLAAGDFVIGSDGGPVRVLAVYPQESRKVWAVTFSDGVVVRCGPEHLWTVRDDNMAQRNRGWITKTTAELKERGLKLSHGGSKFEIPQFPGHRANNDPQMNPWLLGQLLGNGCLSGVSNGSGIVITSNSEDADVVDRLLDLGGVDRGEYGGSRRVGFNRGSHGSMYSLIEAWGLNVKSLEKHIPGDCFLWNMEARQELLRGLMDSDGSNHKNMITFHTCSRQLATDTANLVRSLGGAAVVREYNRSDGKPVEWQVNVHTAFCPFFSERKHAGWRADWRKRGNRIVSMERVADEDCVCILVDSPDHLYVTTGYKLTHNTIQGIGISNADPSVRSVLVICPASLKLNWQREWQKWDVKDLSVGIANGKDFPATDVVVVNYDIIGKHRETIDARQWDLMIVDECHYLKNPDTIRTKAVLGNRKKEVKGIAAKRRAFLTGTPIVNRPVELWPLVQALDPQGLGRSFWSYAQRYCGATNNGWGWDFGGASHLDELQEKLRSTFMVRRLKSEVLTELPPKVRQVIEIPADGLSGLVAKETAMAQRHEELMDALRAAAELAKAEGAEAFNVAVKKLRDAGSVAFEEMAQARHDLALAKVPYLVEHLEDAVESSGKVVVMVWHRDVISALMEKFGDRAVQVHGGVSITDRQAAVDRFQTDPTCQVFVGSIKAAGVGLTLTAASHVVFGELWWVPGDITQAEDRCHRIGQANSVLVQHLVVDGSLDARMAKVMVAKQNVIDYALDKGLALPEPPDAPVVLWADEADEAETEPEKAKAPATKGMTVDQIEADAAKLTDAQVEAVHEALRILAGLNWDLASEKNDVGFNRYDTRIGMELAAMPVLTKRQAALGANMVRKYHRQLPAGLLATVKGE